MAERNAVSKLLNGDGPVSTSQPPGGPYGAGAPGGGPAVGVPGGSAVCTPGGGGGGGGQAIFTASAIRALGGRIAALAPMLERVASSLDGTEIEAAAFSGCGVALANVYPQAQAFGKDDAKSKSTQLDQMAEKLKSTALTWEQAEQASTVQPQK